MHTMCYCSPEFVGTLNCLWLLCDGRLAMILTSEERNCGMNRTVFVNIGITVLLVVIIVLLLKLSSLNSAAAHESEQLNMSVSQLRDSLKNANLGLDSLRAQAPGLGDYMSTIQLHVSKLWFAGQASNWKLAKYELGELEETIDGAEALHAKKNGVDVSAVLQSVQQTQLPLVEKSIVQHNLRDFGSAYNQTLAACNGCHRPAGYEFIHIIVPTREPVTNQQWKVGTQ